MAFAPRVVRLGRKETAAATSQEYLLETIVEERMASLRRQSQGSLGSADQIATKLQQVSAELLLAEQSASEVVEDSHTQVRLRSPHTHTHTHTHTSTHARSS